MAKKKDIVQGKPVLSKMPLPKSDSALVIDLPDGQKLVIGRMSAGTVIEVATWRGVGRPDSRTNRMMFGMSTAEIDGETPGEATIQNHESADKNLVGTIIGYPLRLVKWLLNIQPSPTRKRKSEGKKKLLIEAPTDYSATPRNKVKPKFSFEPLLKKINLIIKNSPKVVKKKDASSSPALDTEMEDWLNSIRSKHVPPTVSESPTDSKPKAPIESFGKKPPIKKKTKR